MADDRVIESDEFFALQMRWLPTSGYGEPRHLVLPAITLGLVMAAFIMRLTRSSMLADRRVATPPGCGRKP